MAPSLPPFQFRTCRKGLSDWDQTPGPPQHPSFPAQFWQGCQTGTGISCLLPSPTGSHIVFLFQELLHMELDQENGKRRSVSIHLQVCVWASTCLRDEYLCTCLGVSIYVLACICLQVSL